MTPSQPNTCDDLASESFLADLGELAGPVVHEFNNFLNATLLHLAVLEQDVPESLRGELAEINRQGKSIAALLKQWQQCRRHSQPAPHPVDLKRVVRAAVERLKHEPINLKPRPEVHVVV